MTDQKQDLVLECTGETAPISIFKVSQQWRANKTFSTSYSVNRSTAGNIRFRRGTSNDVIRAAMAGRRQIIANYGVQILPDAIGL